MKNHLRIVLPMAIALAVMLSIGGCEKPFVCPNSNIYIYPDKDVTFTNFTSGVITGRIFPEDGITDVGAWFGPDENNLKYVSGSLNGQDASVAISGLEAGANYVFKLCAKHGKKDEHCSELISFFTLPEGPIDLDLPSGTLWAVSNVGAKFPWDAGGFFAWGETEPKGEYTWQSYKYCQGSQMTLTKYVHKLEHGSNYGYQGYIDNKHTLDKEDDVAIVKMGSPWCMPTEYDFQEIKQNCLWKKETVSGVKGMLVSSKINPSDPKKKVFFPSAGFMSGPSNASVQGFYWACELSPSSSPCYAIDMCTDTQEITNSTWSDRPKGLSVRAVQHK